MISFSIVFFFFFLCGPWALSSSLLSAATSWTFGFDLKKTDFFFLFFLIFDTSLPLPGLEFPSVKSTREDERLEDGALDTPDFDFSILKVGREVDDDDDDDDDEDDIKEEEEIAEVFSGSSISLIISVCLEEKKLVRSLAGPIDKLENISTNTTSIYHENRQPSK